MTWLPLLLLALLALAPLAHAMLRPRAARGRREADLAFHRAQLLELDRERDAGRMSEAAHRSATIEVQRRLLAAGASEERPADGGRLPAAALLLLPLILAASVGLYLMRGAPGMPSAPYALRAEIAAHDEQLLATLRARLAAMDQRGEATRQGWILLGNAERERGQSEQAAESWRRALEIRFDAGLASDIAEMLISRGDPAAAAGLIERGLAAAPGDPRLRFLAGMAEVAAGRPANARALWQALLADAPADAPWRPVVERELNALP